MRALSRRRRESFFRSHKVDIFADIFVMPDLIRHPVLSWIPACSGMTKI
jgi:hypothetical protein